MSLYAVRWTCPFSGSRKRRDFHSREKAEGFLALPRVEPLREVEVKAESLYGSTRAERAMRKTVRACG